LRQAQDDPTHQAAPELPGRRSCAPGRECAFEPEAFLKGCIEMRADNDFRRLEMISQPSVIAISRLGIAARRAGIASRTPEINDGHPEINSRAPGINSRARGNAN
jgi:hypothetical protein